MPHGPTFFPSKGACIYCGSNTVALSDEHIVPLALGGFHVLRNASCATCANVTSKFERKIAQGLWGDARISYDAPSRRRAQRPDHILMPDTANPGRTISVPAAEYPAALIFYEMAAPGILQGLREEADISSAWKFSVIHDDQRMKNFIEKYAVTPAFKFTHSPEDFGRLIAKIGYGQALTFLNPGDFEPLCLPYIMGEKKNVSYIVGGTGKVAAPSPGIGYELNTHVVVVQNRMLLVSTVRLYSNTHAPGYQVIVGEVAGEENLRKMREKLSLPTS